jgi:antitoxin component YwqK of YwqJK toxin-antitoxin module
MRSGQFLAGERIGKWTTYARNGKIVRVTEFKGKK